MSIERALVIAILVFVVRPCMVAVLVWLALTLLPRLT